MVGNCVIGEVLEENLSAFNNDLIIILLVISLWESLPLIPEALLDICGSITVADLDGCETKDKRYPLYFGVSCGSYEREII